jgi:hypothetical protein
VTERKALLVRMDPGVHEALERWARDELRSVNAQIEFVLRDALRRAGRLVGQDGRTGGRADGPSDESRNGPPARRPAGPPHTNGT